jgi:hypothetical protein
MNCNQNTSARASVNFKNFCAAERAKLRRLCGLELSIAEITAPRARRKKPFCFLHLGLAHAHRWYGHFIAPIHSPVRHRSTAHYKVEQTYSWNAGSVGSALAITRPRFHRYRRGGSRYMMVSVPCIHNS